MPRKLSTALLALSGFTLICDVSTAAPCPPSLSVQGGTTAAGTPCPQAVGSTYSTTFAVAENPLSEGGVWTHNSANLWQKIQTQNGNAIAAAYTEDVDDAYAYLANWVGNDYEITATILYSGLSAGETELLLRVSDSPSGVSAYEFLY